MSPVSAELCALNAALERNELTELPVTLWQQWIWGSDPHEPAELLNACHLRGLLVARFRGRFRAEELFGAVGDALPNLVHAATKPRELGLVQVGCLLHCREVYANS